MDHLRRELAPISDRAWEAIEEEATRTLRHLLAGRPFVDVVGPRGWDHAAEPTGRITATESPVEGVEAAVRGVRPMLELRTPFRLSRAELDAIDRGAGDADLAPLVEAARQAALAEDRLIFQGHAATGITGLAGGSVHAPLRLTEDYDEYPRAVARAVAALRTAGVGGPYGIALGPRCYTGVIETTQHGGYPVLEHVRLILGGPIIWAPSVEGAVVVSMRGGDAELVIGQDFAIGYQGHTDDAVELYLEESVTLRVHDDRAAVALRYEG